MAALSVSTLEDVILGFFVEAKAASAGSVLLREDIASEWAALGLREGDLVTGLQSLQESGICQIDSTVAEAPVALTAVGATYLHTSAMLGIKFMLTRRALRWNVERLRSGKRRRRDESVATGRRRRSDDA
jgi:hypothetical protein